MAIQFLLGNRLIRAAVSLGFLGCLIAASTASGQAEIGKSAAVTANFCGSPCANPNNCSDLMLSVPVEIGLSDEFGIALEDDDSIEMLRVDIQGRTSGVERVALGRRVGSKAASHTRPNISPPLLV
jgi:hypothetical protein